MSEDPIIEVTKVSDKGQVVIPKAIRDKFNFSEGSKLIVVGTEDAVILQRLETIASRVKTKELLDRVKWLADRLGFGHV